MTDKFNIDDVVAVYKGIPNHCMCGCSGDYAYTPHNREYASKDRGYRVTDYEVNMRKVKARLNKFYNSFCEMENIDNYIYTKEISSKVQITVYLKQK